MLTWISWQGSSDKTNQGSSNFQIMDCIGALLGLELIKPDNIY